MSIFHRNNVTVVTGSMQSLTACVPMPVVRSVRISLQSIRVAQTLQCPCVWIPYFPDLIIPSKQLLSYGGSCRAVSCVKEWTLEPARLRVQCRLADFQQLT